MNAPAPSARRRAALIRLLVLALGLMAGGFLLKSLGAAPGTAWVDEYVLGQGLLGDAIFVLAGAALTAAGVPRQGIAFLGGYAFGAVEGTALTMAAQILGCGLAYAWARAIGRPWAEARLAGRFGHRLRPMRDVLIGSPFGATLALRLLPIGNNLAVNLLAGMAGVPFVAFLGASALGYVPQTVIFALLGKGIRVDGVWQMGLAAALFVVSVVIGLWLLRRHRAGRVLEDQA
ncbi:MAG: hypothetical protein RLZZ57_1897 [Pseudomonadota bacterium]|jgi:uncharacterized membrane protein YdjX (TVP38/TMEM64 family)